MKRRFLLALGGLAVPLGCTTTPYSFFEEGTSTCLESCGGAGGSSLALGGAPSLEPGANCESRIYEGKTVERIQLAGSKGCLVADIYAPLNGFPAYYLYVRSCEVGEKSYFSIFETAGVLELRNESTRFNVDVVYAATDSGVPLFLYAPHDLYNQHFKVFETASGAFRLAPLNATTQCLSERSGRLELWPCADGDSTQLFSRLACR